MLEELGVCNEKRNGQSSRNLSIMRHGVNVLDGLTNCLTMMLL